MRALKSLLSLLLTHESCASTIQAKEKPLRHTCMQKDSLHVSLSTLSEHTQRTQQQRCVSSVAARQLEPRNDAGLISRLSGTSGGIAAHLSLICSQRTYEQGYKYISAHR